MDKYVLGTGTFVHLSIFNCEHFQAPLICAKQLLVKLHLNYRVNDVFLESRDQRLRVTVSKHQLNFITLVMNLMIGKHKRNLNESKMVE